MNTFYKGIINLLIFLSEHPFFCTKANVANVRSYCFSGHKDSLVVILTCPGQEYSINIQGSSGFLYLRPSRKTPALYESSVRVCMHSGDDVPKTTPPNFHFQLWLTGEDISKHDSHLKTINNLQG